MTYSFTVPEWLIVTLGWIAASLLTFFAGAAFLAICRHALQQSFKQYGGWRNVALFYRWWHSQGGKDAYPEYRQLRDRIEAAQEQSKLNFDGVRRYSHVLDEMLPPDKRRRIEEEMARLRGAQETRR